MSDVMKDMAVEISRVNETIKGICNDFREFGISFKDAQGAMQDQADNIKKLQECYDGFEIKMAKNGQFKAAPTASVVFEMPEVKGMFDYIRGKKSMSVNDGESGGYLVHNDYLNYVFEKVRDVDEIRANATVLSTSGSAIEIPTENGDAGLAWVGETEDRKETDAPTFGKVNIPVNEAQAKVRITRNMRQDASFNIEDYVTRKLIDRITRGEATEFVNGKGASTPEGLWTCKDIKTIASGKASDITADNLLDMTAELPWAMESECAFIINKRTEVALRKLKDTTGQYLWNPSLVAGMPPTFAGYRIIKAPSAPSIAANECPVMFGALKDYAIVDRTGVELIMDDISESLRSKNLIEFEFDCRLGGAVVQPSSFVKLKCATS